MYCHIGWDWISWILRILYIPAKYIIQSCTIGTVYAKYTLNISTQYPFRICVCNWLEAELYYVYGYSVHCLYNMRIQYTLDIDTCYSFYINTQVYW